MEWWATIIFFISIMSLFVWNRKVMNESITLLEKKIEVSRMEIVNVHQETIRLLKGLYEKICERDGKCS